MAAPTRPPQRVPRPVTWLGVCVALAIMVFGLYLPYEFQSYPLRFVHPYMRWFGVAFGVCGLLTGLDILRAVHDRWLGIVGRTGLFITLATWAWLVAFRTGVLTGEIAYTTILTALALAWAKPAWEPRLLEGAIAFLLISVGLLMWRLPGSFPPQIYGHLTPLFTGSMIGAGLILIPWSGANRLAIATARLLIAAAMIARFAFQWLMVHNWNGVVVYGTIALILLMAAADRWLVMRPVLSGTRRRVIALVVAACTVPLFTLGSEALYMVEGLDRQQSISALKSEVSTAEIVIRESLAAGAALTRAELTILVQSEDPATEVRVVDLVETPVVAPPDPVEQRGADGQLYMSAYARIPEWNLGVVATQSTFEVYRRTERVAVLLLAGTFLIGLIATVISYALAKRVTSQLVQVWDATAQIGGQALGWEHVPPVPPDELLGVASVVREMAEHIIGSTRRIQEQNEELRAQTEELEAQTSLLEARERWFRGLTALGQTALEGADLTELGNRARQVVADSLGITMQEAAELLPDPGLPTSAAVADLSGEERTFLEAVSHVLLTAASRRQIQTELALAGQRTVSILESITDAFFAVDRDWRFVYVNRRVEELFQISRDQLLGQDMWQITDISKNSAVEARYRGALSHQTAAHFGGYSDATGRWYEVDLYPSPAGLSVYFRDVTEQQEAQERIRQEAAQRESEHRRLLAVLSLLPVGVFIAEPDGRLIEANEEARRIWGAAPLVDGIAGYCNYRARRAETGQPIGATDWGLARALTLGETSLAEELVIETFDGQEKTVLNSALPVRDESGAIISSIATVVDITERKRMEQELRANEQLLQQQNAILQLIARGAPIQEVLVAVGHFVEAHCDGAMAALQMLDRSRTALSFAHAPHLPDHFREAFPSIPIGPQAGPGCAIWAGEPVIAMDIMTHESWAELRGKAAGHGIAACWSYPVRIATGEPMGVLSVYLGQSRAPSVAEARLLAAACSLAGIAVERSRVEEARLLKLLSLIEQMGEGVLALDDRGQILAINPAAARMLKLPGEPGDGIQAGTGLPGDLLDLVGRISHTESGESHRLMLRRGDTELEAYVSPVEARWGDRQGAIALLHDITAEAQFRRLQQSFVANVSHELRGPLTSLSAAVEALLDGLVPQDQQLRYLRRILAELSRLQRLSHDLVDLSRLDAGAVELNCVEFRLRTLIEAVAEKFAPRCDAANLHLVAKPTDLQVRADYDRVDQILSNLLENAIKFTPPGGTVRVRVNREGSEARVDVADSGAGIAPEHLPYVWERFYQVDAARTLTPERGAGLGLSIVRQLVNAMGGQVQIESDLGKGTTVSFTLPLA